MERSFRFVRYLRSDFFVIDWGISTIEISRQIGFYYSAIAYCTIIGSSYSAHMDLFSSSVLSCSISSLVSSKSKMSRFCFMRSLCTLLGITTMPRWTCWRRATCAGVFPWTSAIYFTMGLSRISFSRCCASGPHASCWILYFAIHSCKSYCCQKRCVST